MKINTWFELKVYPDLECVELWTIRGEPKELFAFSIWENEETETKDLVQLVRDITAEVRRKA